MRNLKKRGKYLVAAVVVIFVGINLFLLLKQDSKAARTVNINHWTSVENGNVKKLMHTTGVTKPETETHVYFDRQKGILDKMLVKEGDVVSNGTPLFSYNSQKLEDTKADLEDEADKLQGEMDSIDQEISQLQQITPDDSSNHTSTTSKDKKVNVDVEVNTSSIVEGNIQQKVAEAEAEKGKVDAALTVTEAKISRVEEQLADLNVKSTVDGQIVKINTDLKDPMMTIVSTNLVVKAIVPAKKVGEVAEGQSVKLYSTLTKKNYNGTVLQVITYPNKTKKDKKADPTYSFLVKITGEATKPNKVAKNDQATAGTSSETQNLQSNGQTATNLTIEEQNQSSEQSNDQATTQDDQANQTTNAQVGSTAVPSTNDKPLLIGTNMKLQVTLAEATKIPVIYSKAMLKDSKKHYVYKLTNKGMVQKQEVLLGVTYKGKNQVIKGLEASDVIVKNKDSITLRSTSSFITPLKTAKIQNKELKKLKQSQQAKYILIGLFE